MRNFLLKVSLVLVFFVFSLLNGCRGYSSSQPPIHLNPNMDTQEKGKAYRESDFFADGRYMRVPIAGTVPRGKLKADDHFYRGRVNGQLAKSFPPSLKMDANFLERGQRVYQQKCSACHSQVGDGDGLVGKRLMVKPTTFHSEYMYGLPPGHFFEVITKGIRTMQPYAHMISEIDRWAVVAFIRSLQMSQDINGKWIKRSALWWTQK
jgi:mono/diheme cytochrome c family protein